MLLVDPGSYPSAPLQGGDLPTTVEDVAVELGPELQRSQVTGLRSPTSGEQTIKPDAKLLFVAGAGWTKKQADGQPHPERPKRSSWATCASRASLGSTKSLVDQTGEGQTVLEFMTHLNQVGQTGSTPRHPRGSPPAAMAKSRTRSAGASFANAGRSTWTRTAAGPAGKPTSFTWPTPSPWWRSSTCSSRRRRADADPGAPLWAGGCTSPRRGWPPERTKLGRIPGWRWPPPSPHRTATAVPQLAGTDANRAFLLVLAGPQLGDVHPPPPTAPCSSEAAGEDADIPLRDDGPRLRHATVQVGQEGAKLTDLGSANGTFVDGVRASEVMLDDGARIAVGSATVLKFVWTDELEARWQLRVSEGAQVDPRTGPHNRRYLDERLEGELSACSVTAARSPCSCSTWTISRGSTTSTVIWRVTRPWGSVAEALREAVRKEDVLARYGGEEFVVLARETALEGGRVLCERLRLSVERGRCHWRGPRLSSPHRSSP